MYGDGPRGLPVGRNVFGDRRCEVDGLRIRACSHARVSGKKKEGGCVVLFCEFEVRVVVVRVVVRVVLRRVVVVRVRGACRRVNRGRGGAGAVAAPFH